MSELERARSALWAIPADLSRDVWVRVGMAAHAAGLAFDEWDAWSQQGPTYNAQACRATWCSFKTGKGVGAGTLYAIAREHGATGKPGAPPLRPCIELEAAIVKAAGHLTCETARRSTRTREAITGLVARGVLACNEGWIWMAA